MKLDGISWFIQHEGNNSGDKLLRSTIAQTQGDEEEPKHLLHNKTKHISAANHLLCFTNMDPNYYFLTRTCMTERAIINFIAV